MTNYIFDLNKFDNLITESEILTQKDFVNAMLKSFNINKFNYYLMITSILYYKDKLKHLEEHFEFTAKFLLLVYIVNSNSFDENSEEVIRLKEKINQSWKIINNDCNEQLP